MSIPAPELPGDHRVLGQLSESSEHTVLRAVWRGRAAVTRIDRSAERGQALAELGVLAKLQHPCVGELLDYGTLDDGSLFVTREWIEGEPLDQWARSRTTEELAALVVRLCSGLDALHRAGAVHADLKPSNVLVLEDGSPRLCDFGLSVDSGQRSSGSGVSGSLFYMAPETLGGRSVGPPADLFALGVMIHGLTAGGWPSAGEFYARFPRHDFLEAVGTLPEDLPSWCRDLVPALVARSPEDRPRSARHVAWSLAARLGLEAGLEEVQPEVVWSPSRARRDWIRTRADDLAMPRAGAPPVWWLRLPRDEDADELASSLHLEALLRSLEVAQRSFSADSTGDLRAFDEWLEALPDVGSHVVLSARRRDPAVERALAWAARAAQRSTRVRGLVVVCSGPPVAEELAWRERPVPPLDRDLLRSWLAEELEETDPRRLSEFATSLLAACEGSSTGLGELLCAASERGLFVRGEERPRLRPGGPPRANELAGLLATTDHVELDAEQARLLGWLWVRGAPADPETLARELGCSPGTLVETARGLVARGFAHAVAGGLEPTPRGGGRAPTVLSPAEQRQLHQLQHAALGPGDPRRLVHAVCGLADSAPDLLDAVDELAAELEERRERGAPDRVLALLDRLETQLASQGRELPPTLVAERAFAWLVLGRSGRALQLAAALDASRDPSVRATVARIRGFRALRAHENEEALRHYAEAGRLAPEREGEARVAEISLLHTGGRHEEVIERVTTLEDWPATLLSDRQRALLGSLAALSRFALGEPYAARDELAALCEQARERGDPLREAALWTDRARVERRLGNLDQALSHLRRAERLCDDHGLLATLAHVRSDLAGVHRERGELRRAEELLTSAAALREGIGDREGNAVVRGLAGLVLAERGHLAAALAEFDAALAGLGPSRKRRHAPLLEARAEELEARLGRPARRSRERTLGSDPRCALFRGRTAFLRGQLDLARPILESALATAHEHGSRPVSAEARLVLALVQAEDGAGPEILPEPQDGGLAEDDRALLALILAPRGYFDRQGAEALALALEERGRDDRAARLWMALAARVSDRERAARWNERAEACFERCARGLDERECRALSRTLLGLPDPRPDDLFAEPLPADPVDAGLVQLLEINHRLIQQEDLPSLLGAIVESALDITGAERGFLVLEEDGELRLDTALDSRRGDIDEPLTELSRSILDRALEAGEPQRFSNAREHPSLAAAKSVVELDLRSVLCAPFSVHSALRGAIYLDHRLETSAFSDTSQHLLGLLAGQAALAVQQLDRLEMLRDKNRHLAGRVASAEADLAQARRELREAGALAVGGLVGRSDQMRDLRAAVVKYAAAELPVLVTGPSGTGKELVARALHCESLRGEGPLVMENCAALPPSLIEAELFGHAQGAFTGADQARAGLFERADGGTLVLDEVGELPLEIQAKLLRVLENRTVRRVGENEERAVDFRLVAATNRDLGQEVAAGRFREDLYYRLAGLRVALPGLATRIEDIPDLVAAFLRADAERTGAGRRAVAPEVLERLCLRPWPGNVRELKSEIARLCVLTSGDLDDPDLVGSPLESTAPTPTGPRTLAAAEREAIIAALQHTGGNKRRAAECLGVSRSKLYATLQQWRDDDDWPDELG